MDSQIEQIIDDASPFQRSAKARKVPEARLARLTEKSPEQAPSHITHSGFRPCRLTAQSVIGLIWCTPFCG
jgi:hypothetical protein